MTISPFLIYLWQLADSIGIASILIFLPTTFIAIISWLSRNDMISRGYAKEAGEPSRVFKTCKILSIGSLLVGTFGPSSDTLAMMYVLPKISHSEAIQKDWPELYTLAVDALKAQLQEAAK